MKDPFLEAQVNLAFQYPSQTFLFFVGGAALAIGILIATLTSSEGKWGRRGLALTFGGTLTAIPAVIPMALQFIGDGTSPDSPLFNAIISALIYICPVVGFSAVAMMWWQASKLTTKLNSTV